MDLGKVWFYGTHSKSWEGRRVIDKGRVYCFLLVLQVFMLYPGLLLYAQKEALRVQSIEIQGNQHIDVSVVQSSLTLKVGDLFSTAASRKQIQQIYEMGFFEDVQVQTEPVPNGVRVVILVREKPFNVEIIFDGIDHFSEDSLQEKITVRTQVFLDQEQVKVSAEKIRQAYQQDGYNNAEIIPVVQTIEENRTRLTFFIKEGARARIETVRFEGRTVVEKSDLLSVMATREWFPILSWITDAGILNQDEIPNDIERIKEMYMNKGYLDVEVGMPTIELDEDKEWFTVTFPIVEGEPYTVSQVTYQNNTVFDEETLQAASVIQPDEIFQRAKIREEVTRLTELYGDLGYAFAEATPSILPNPTDRTTEISFTIDEGKLIRIREINITGNDKTRDNVIRRELRMDEGDLINSLSMKRSFQRLNNLKYFETVEIIPEQIDERHVDLNVEVKEKPTGSFSIGGGFSTLDSFTLITNITEGNFLGKGYLVRIRGQLGIRRSLGVLTFRNPALYDGPTSLQVDGFATTTDFRTFREKKVGGNVTLGQSFSEYLSGSLTLIAEKIRINDIDSDASDTIQDQEGTQSTTGFRVNLTRETRDNFVDPRSGTRMGVRGSFGTDLLGGSNNFYAMSLDVLKFTSLPFWDLRHSIRGRIGVADGYGGEDLPVTEFFFVGGINTVRGFKFGRAGPVTSSNDPEGGNKQLIFNNDLVFPVIPQAKLNGVLFFDYGQGFENGESLDLDLRPATGLEVRWISPFGPLRAAWGLNLDPKDGEKKTVFEFSVGSTF